MMDQSILMGRGVGPFHYPEMEAQSWVPQQRDFAGYTDGEMAGEEEDFSQLMMQTRPQKEEPAPVDETAGGQEKGIQKVRADKETVGSASTRSWNTGTRRVTDTGDSRGQ